ncbi:MULTISPECIES: DUF4113 domain-containing protein [unclassified Pseudomonas]|uniref:DUF4113 domain-containing protein n=1 Tax=unclassified Pseudomonas TaxID=196821 RepID=UPI001784ED1A|nr:MULTISPECIES: DUF4113 domain-containing protein [unclassified Pseudomonas]MBD9656461.1 DUF4113 domain-containing protein [Pseudomonas sp. PDM12]
MAVLDEITGSRGRSLRPCRVELQTEWGMQQEMLSQSYKTRLDQLWRVGVRPSTSRAMGVAIRLFAECRRTE